MKKDISWIIVFFVFVGVILCPSVSYLFGKRAVMVNNRSLRKKVQVNLHDIGKTQNYHEISEYLIDNLPLRHYGIYFYAWVKRNIFAESPSPQVILGEDGWLFYDRTFNYACNAHDISLIVRQIGRVGELIERSGRKFLFVVAPDKQAIYPEKLGDYLDWAKCAAEKRQELEQELENYPPPGYVNMWQILRNKKRFERRLLYYPHDTHWSTVSIIGLVKKIIEDVAPGLWVDSELKSTGKREFVGDLTRIMGLPEGMSVEAFSFHRDVLVKEQRKPEKHLQAFNTYPLKQGRQTQLIDAKVFILHDSFMLSANYFIKQFFKESVFLEWKEAKHVDVLKEMLAADIVIIEVVERAVYRRIIDVFGRNELENKDKEMFSSDRTIEIK